MYCGMLSSTILEMVIGEMMDTRLSRERFAMEILTSRPGHITIQPHNKQDLPRLSERLSRTAGQCGW